MSNDSSEVTPEITADTILVATRTYVTFVDGQQITVRKGQTRVRAGHPLYEAAPDSFKPVDAQFDVETARNEPPAPPAPAKKAAAPAPAKKAAAAPGNGDGDK